MEFFLFDMFIMPNLTLLLDQFNLMDSVQTDFIQFAKL